MDIKTANESYDITMTGCHVCNQVTPIMYYLHKKWFCDKHSLSELGA